MMLDMLDATHSAMTLDEALSVCETAALLGNDDADQALLELRFQRAGRPAPATEYERARREAVIIDREQAVVRCARRIVAMCRMTRRAA